MIQINLPIRGVLEEAPRGYIPTDTIAWLTLNADTPIDDDKTVLAKLWVSSRHADIWVVVPTFQVIPREAGIDLPPGSVQDITTEGGQQ